MSLRISVVFLLLVVISACDNVDKLVSSKQSAESKSEKVVLDTQETANIPTNVSGTYLVAESYILDDQFHISTSLIDEKTGSPYALKNGESILWGSEGSVEPLSRSGTDTNTFVLTFAIGTEEAAIIDTRISMIFKTVDGQILPSDYPVSDILITNTGELADGSGPGGVSRGLSLWLDGSDMATVFMDDCASSSLPVSTNLQMVTCWKDKSGLNNHVESLPGMGALFIIDPENNRSYMDFSGAQRYIGVLPQFTGDQEHTIFIAVSTSPGEGSQYVVSVGNAGDNEKLHISQIGTNGRLRHGFWNNDTDYLTTQNDDIFQSFTFDYNGQAPLNPVRRAWNNDLLTKNPNSSSDTTSPLALPENAELAIGGRNSEQFHSGEIGEILLFDRVLSDNERAAVQAYIAAKWAPQ